MLLCKTIGSIFTINAISTGTIKIFRFHHRYIFSMDIAYLKYLDSADEFHLNFHYKNLELKVDRTFNFSRKISENIETFLSRVSTNVEKVIVKKNKKKKNEEKPDVDVKVELLNNNNVVDKHKICKEVFKQNNLVLRVLEKEYTIIKNCPWIDCVNLPSILLANYPVYPIKFEISFASKEQCEFFWFKSEDKMNWTQVGNGFIFEPSNVEINCYLKLSCTPKNDNLEGPTTEVISKGVVQASPGQCPFEMRHLFTQDKKSDKQFRVVTYNILADLYCDSDFSRNSLYPYCPPYALNIDYRKLLIMKELKGYNADIMCLQEVDRKIYHNDLQPVFENLGFNSEFCLKGGLVAEGLACFYNTNRFSLVDKDSAIIADRLLEKKDSIKNIVEAIFKNDKLKERILARTTAVQVLVLKSVENDQILLIANTHLYFHPDADHIRLLQGALALQFVQEKKETIEKNFGKKVSVIFCGDFNSVPECGIYQLYTTGHVSSTCIDWKSNEEEAVVDLNLSQPIKLASACGTPEYTNYTEGFKGCLDYIFYDTDTLEVKEVIPMPSHENVSQYGALPSVTFPSDHISLISVLNWKTND